MRNTFMAAISSAALAFGLGAIPAAGVAAETGSATATLMTADGKPAGTAEFSQGPHGVVIKVMVSGLTPGIHGIHIHQTGQCTPDFAAAGDHFNPDGSEHGFLANGPHAGDLPNIAVGVDGTAVAHFFNTRISLGDGEASLFDQDGAALIVHENADTYGADAGAGGREACGVIEPGV